jgi:hypothetical protein
LDVGQGSQTETPAVVEGFEEEDFVPWFEDKFVLQGGVVGMDDSEEVFGGFVVVVVLG